MMKDFKKLPLKNKLLIIFAVLLGAGLIFSAVRFRINASSTGGAIGTSTGTLTGKAVGSLEGMTKGQAEGRDAGKEAGLSAEDTEAEISSQIHQVEKLEVLVASVKLRNFHTIGKEENPDYAALYLVNGNVVFTVDMGQAEITAEGDSLHIALPEPAGTLYLDDSSIEKVADYQKTKNKGSAEDGYYAYLNTMAKVQEASEETLDNYDLLISSAKEAAERQVAMLAKAVSTSYDNVVIEWLA